MEPIEQAVERARAKLRRGMTELDARYAPRLTAAMAKGLEQEEKSLVQLEEKARHNPRVEALLRRALALEGEAGRSTGPAASATPRRPLPQPLEDQARALVQNAEVFALALHAVVAAQCPTAATADVVQWNFLVTVASVFIAVSRLNDVQADDARKDELRRVVEDGLDAWDGDAGRAFDDCTAFFEQAHQQLAAAGHPPEFVACDALGKWIVWNLFSSPPKTPEHVRLVRIVGGTIVSSFHRWWSDAAKQHDGGPRATGLAGVGPPAPGHCESVEGVHLPPADAAPPAAAGPRVCHAGPPPLETRLGNEHGGVDLGSPRAGAIQEMGTIFGCLTMLSALAGAIFIVGSLVTLLTGTSESAMRGFTIGAALIGIPLALWGALALLVVRSRDQ